MAKINLKEKQKEKKIDRGVNRAKINWKEKKPYQAPEPTEAEYMMMAIAELDAQRAFDKTESEMAIAELAEIMMGGMFNNGKIILQLDSQRFKNN